MQTITIKETSKLLIGEKMDNLSQYLPSANVVIITDTNLYRLYAQKFPDVPVITIETGEGIKTLKTVEFIIDKLIELQVDRHSFLLGIGGGVVCDITGFVASVYMRGIDFGFVSTSLLSQVDASIGGKNGVNFSAYKNLIGTFNQPQFVICDTEMLATLPNIEIQNGMAEIIKHALIADKEMLQLIADNTDKILNLDTDILPLLIEKNIKIKAKIVASDEKEQGKRKILNFGHTLAHAIETVTHIPHGQAVAIGMVFASKLSYQQSYISKTNLEDIISLIKSLGLPTNIDGNKTQIIDVIAKDKKRNGETLDFILLNSIGQARIETMGIDDLKKLFYDLC